MYLTRAKEAERWYLEAAISECRHPERLEELLSHFGELFSHCCIVQRIIDAAATNGRLRVLQVVDRWVAQHLPNFGRTRTTPRNWQSPDAESLLSDERGMNAVDKTHIFFRVLVAAAKHGIDEGTFSLF